MSKNPFENPGPSSAALRSPMAGGLAEASLGTKLGVVPLSPLPLKHFAGSFLLYLGSLLLLVLALGFALPEDRNAVGAVVSFAGAALLAIPPTVLLLRRGKGTALTLHERGFVLSRGAVRRPVRYEAIDELTFVDREQLDNGRPSGRTFRVVIAGADGKVRFDHFAKLGARDAGIEGLGRIVSGASDAAAARVKAGNPLRGKGWQLGPEGLVDTRSKDRTPIRLDRLASVAVFSGKVAIWRAGDELPVFAVPAGTGNAAILRELASRAVDETAAAPAGALGRLLVEKRASRVIGFGILFVAAVLLLFSVGPLFDETMPGLLGIGLAAAGLLLAWGGAVVAFTKVRFHEGGLVKAGPFGSRELSYPDIAEFTFSATRHYHNGVYTGTAFVLAFLPREGKKITLSTSTRGSDDDLDFVREEVGRIVAGNLLGLLRATGSVAWGKEHRLTAKTVEVLPGMMGLRKAKSLPIESLTFAVEAGVLRLFAVGVKGTATTVSCNGPNFWPGMMLLEHLASEMAPKSPEAVPVG